jgi:hypothetical protein
MAAKHSARQQLAERGPRWAIWIETGRHHAEVHYADTAAQAEKLREIHLADWSHNEQRVQLYPPAEAMSLGRAASQRLKAETAFKKKTAILKTVVLQALAQGRSEAEVARSAGVDRMTIRAWAGK